MQAEVKYGQSVLITISNKDEQNRANSGAVFYFKTLAAIN